MAVRAGFMRAHVHVCAGYTSELDIPGISANCKLTATPKKKPKKKFKRKKGNCKQTQALDNEKL
jgi:hypothetical protein